MAKTTIATPGSSNVKSDVISPSLPAAAQREIIVVNVPGLSTPKSSGWSDAASSIAGALAWPVTILLLLWLFKLPITRLIDRLRTFKGVGMEVSAEAMIQEELPVRLLAHDVPDMDPLTSPIGTIVTAWVNLEKATRDAAMRVLPSITSGTRTMPYSTVLRNVEAIERAGFLTDPAVRPLIGDLAKIRNRAVHQPDQLISRDALMQFVANANWAIGKLEQVEKKV